MATNGTARVDHDSKELIDMGSLGMQQCVGVCVDVCVGVGMCVGVCVDVCVGVCRCVCV